MSLLTVNNVSVRFGGVVALDDLTFTVEPGGICALIGPNGAGKTTFFNVLSRLYQPNSGTVTFDGKDLLATPAHKIVRLGLARTFQNVALFPALTVLENVATGASHGQGRLRPLDAAARPRGAQAAAPLPRPAGAPRPGCNWPTGRSPACPSAPSSASSSPAASPPSPSC